MGENYIEQLARVDREVARIREARAEQALRVTAGYTTDELRAMPDSALASALAESNRLRLRMAELEQEVKRLRRR